MTIFLKREFFLVEKALEGCLVKKIIKLTENHKYTITPEGTNQV